MRLNDLLAYQAQGSGPNPYGEIRAETQAHIDSAFEAGQIVLIQKIDAVEGSLMRELATLKASVDKHLATATDKDSPFRVSFYSRIVDLPRSWLAASGETARAEDDVPPSSSAGPYAIHRDSHGNSGR